MKNAGLFFNLILMIQLLLLPNIDATGSYLPGDANELRTKASQGDATSQYRLGLAYDKGQGVARNPAEAANWYRKAAEQGHPAAQNSLGSMYQAGEGVPRDNAEAVRWYRKAVEQSYPEACTNLGFMYDSGLGVERDRRKAVGLYQMGAEKGSLRGMLNLGVSYYQGEGTPKDLVKAYTWLDLARFYTQQSSDTQLKWRVRGALDEVKKQMTREQITAAEKLAIELDARLRQGQTKP